MIKWIDKNNSNPYKVQTYLFMKNISYFAKTLMNTEHVSMGFNVYLHSLRDVISCYDNQFTKCFVAFDKQLQNHSTNIHKSLLKLGEITQDNVFKKYLHVLTQFIYGYKYSPDFLNSIFFMWKQQNIKIV